MIVLGSGDFPESLLMQLRRGLVRQQLFEIHVSPDGSVGGVIEVVARAI